MQVTVHTLWIRRKGDEYDEAPELAEAWTEFDIDNWLEGWEQIKATLHHRYGDQFRDMREIEFAVDYEGVREAFGPTTVTASSSFQPPMGA